MKVLGIILAITMGCSVYCEVSDVAYYKYSEVTIDKIKGTGYFEIQPEFVDSEEKVEYVYWSNDEI